MDYTLHEWVRMASHHGSIARCAIEKQAEESGLDALAVREKMRHHLRVMQEAAQQGLDERLRSVTGLTGGQAALMMKRLQAGKCLAGNLLGKAEVYALATAECNGCMGKIVAAPTAGACGILPGAVLAMMEEKGATEEQAVDALFVAAAVGQAIATQASISGAEGGCQAECGSAAAMAAAALVYLEGGNPQHMPDLNFENFYRFHRRHEPAGAGLRPRRRAGGSALRVPQRGRVRHRVYGGGHGAQRHSLPD